MRYCFPTIPPPVDAVAMLMTMPAPFHIERRLGRRLRREPDLATAFGAGPWLLFAPHDDDAVLGAGLLLAAAVQAGIEVHVCVVTDGRMGWWRTRDREHLVATRSAELDACLTALGVRNLHWLGFPDSSLHLHVGARRTADGLDGVGLRMAGLMRQVRPSTVFCCSPTDLHPDHRTVSSELDIACFWASGGIWEELGEPCPLPKRFDYAVYCPFRADPDLRLRTDAATFQRKLAGLAAFRSQATIDEMVATIRKAGPVEFFQEVTWKLYDPADYAPLFAARKTKP